MPEHASYTFQSNYMLHYTTSKRKKNPSVSELVRKCSEHPIHNFFLAFNTGKNESLYEYGWLMNAVMLYNYIKVQPCGH